MPGPFDHRYTDVAGTQQDIIVGTGPFAAPLSEIKKVLPYVIATEYGVSTSSTDNSVAIQKAINDIQAGSGGVLWFPEGSYTLANPITINHGTGYNPVRLHFNNSQIWYTGTGSCIIINPIDIRGGAGLGLGYFEIRDLTMNVQTPAGTVGIDIGKTGYIIDAFSECLLDNVMVQNFDTGIRSTETRHITFRDVVIRTPVTKGLFIQTTGGYFCGDHWFIDCEFMSGTHSALHLFTYNAVNNTNGELRGLHFTDCVFYGKSGAGQCVALEGSGYGRMFDIWFTSCALDSGINNPGFSMNMQQNANMGYFHILETYIVNFGAGPAFSFSNSSSFDTGNITIKGCQVGLVNQPFNIFNCQHIQMLDNFFTDVTAKSTFSGACKNVQLINNSFRGAALLASQVVTIAAAVLSAIIKNNFGNYANASTFVENQGTLPATALVIADNLQAIL